MIAWKCTFDYNILSSLVLGLICSFIHFSQEPISIQHQHVIFNYDLIVYILLWQGKQKKQTCKQTNIKNYISP